MSGLRSIEMQVAIPRSQTAGKIQDQLQQRSMVAQEHMQQTQEEKRLKQKKTVTESESAKHKRLNNDDESSQGNKNSHTQALKKVLDDESIEDETSQHPFKGKRFDASW